MDKKRKQKLLEQFKFLCQLRYECGGVEDLPPGGYREVREGSLDSAVLQGAQVMRNAELCPIPFRVWLELFEASIIKLMEKHYEP